MKHSCQNYYNLKTHTRVTIKCRGSFLICQYSTDMSLGRLVIFGGVSYTQLISKLLTDLISICATYQRLFIEHRIHVLLSYSRHIANVIVISASHTQQQTNDCTKFKLIIIILVLTFSAFREMLMISFQSMPMQAFLSARISNITYKLAHFRFQLIRS